MKRIYAIIASILFSASVFAHVQDSKLHAGRKIAKDSEKSEALVQCDDGYSHGEGKSESSHKESSHVEHSHQEDSDSYHDSHDGYGHGHAKPKVDSTSHSDGHGHGHDHGSASEVRMDAEKGLELADEVAKAMNLQTTVAQRKTVMKEFSLTGMVISTRGKTSAAFRVPRDSADEIHGAIPKNARLLSRDDSPATASGFSDFVYELYPNANLSEGDFVSLTLQIERQNALTVPNSAVLEGIDSAIIYAVSDGHYVSRKAKLGIGDADSREILEGVSEGESIVSSPVQQLRLIELRLTKGGGHSH